MNKRAIIHLGAAAGALVSLFIATSFSIQYFSARQIQSHSQYAVGTVTNLYIRTERTWTKTGTYYTYHYQVKYNFFPNSGSTKYSNDQGVSKADYERLHTGGSINIYYDTQKPSVQSIAGYQSDPKGLGAAALTGVIFFIVMLAVFMKTRHAGTKQKETGQSLPASPNSLNEQSDSNLDPKPTATVWFAYPQNNGISFKRKVLQGILTIDNNSLYLNANDGRQILNVQINDITAVKHWAPTMTLYFNNNSKFQLDFRDTRQLRWLLFGPLGGIVTFGNGFDKALANMKPFEVFFTQRGLIK